MAGDHKIMVATGALGSGADVDGIRAVVHFGRPWTMIDYVQEAGRGGRAGEKVVSTIILSQYELNWLRQLTTASASRWDANKEAMRKYLITTDCRRLVMSGYLDLQARTCEELKAELCDNCCSKKKHSKVSSDEEEERQANCEMSVVIPVPIPLVVAPLHSEFKNSTYYGKGIELYEAQVKAEAVREQEIVRALKDMEGQCSVCWLTDPDSADQHDIHGCIELRIKLKRPYQEVRQQMIQYEPNTCCFSCSQPGDWCFYYQNRQKCSSPDHIVPLALMAWLCAETRDLLVNVVAKREFGNIAEYAKWLSRPRRMYGTKATNAMAILEALVKYRSNMKDSA